MEKLKQERKQEQERKGDKERERRYNKGYLVPLAELRTFQL